MSRPSDEFDETELREEFDWMYEFNSRMAEQIRGNPDVHSLHDYVRKIEWENTKLRELVADMWRGMCNNYSRNCFVCRHYPRAASPNCECEFRTRMRELGIEVDQ